MTGPPTMDLFKAIFADSCSDSDGDDSRVPDKPAAEPVASVASVPANNKVEKIRKSRFEPRPVDEESIEQGAVGVCDEMKDCIKDTVTDEPKKHVFVFTKKMSESSAATTNAKEYQAEGNTVKVSHLKRINNSKKHKNKQSVSRSNLSFAVESFSDEDEQDTEQAESNNKSTIQSPVKQTNCERLSTKERKALSTASTPSALPDTSNAEQRRNFCAKNSSPTHIGISKCNEAPSLRGAELLPSKSTKVSSELPPTVKLAQSKITGIFSNIDFVELNKYRERMNVSNEDGNVGIDNGPNSNGEQVTGLQKGLQIDSSGSDSDSSVNSEEAFGAALPPNYVNPMQVIRETPGTTKNLAATRARLGEARNSEVLEKPGKLDRHKNKRSKKDKHKSKSHKKEKRKKHRKQK